MKKSLISLIKFGLAIGLIGWMISTGKLDFSKLAILFNNPLVLLAGITIWATAAVFLSSIRWVFLLRAAGYTINAFRGIQLQLIGLFFNTVMPGSVGGDLIKVLYIIKDNKHLGKTPALLSVLIDRVIGLAGLFTMGSLVLLVASLSGENPVSKSHSYLIYGVTLAWIITLFSCLYLPQQFLDRIEALLDRDHKIFSAIAKLYKAITGYRNHSKALYIGWSFSALLQGLNFIYFFILTVLISDPQASFAKVAAIFPVGITTTALPISPGGLGVGHLAFEELFKSIGMLKGADCFNVFLLSTLSFNLIGIFPYLSIKKSIPLDQSQI